MIKVPIKFYKITAKSADEADISIYGEIGESFWGEDTVSAANFKKDLDALGAVKTLNISINSPGGSVFDGLAIYNMLSRHSATKNVTIDGLAASAASFIAMAGDIITIPENAFMMIHRASCGAWGNADELAKAIELLKSIDNNLVDIYAKRSKKSKKSVRALLDAETWMDGKQAVELGFADELEDFKEVAALADAGLMAKYKNKPVAYHPHTEELDEPDEPEEQEEDEEEDEEEEVPPQEQPAPEELFNLYRAKIKNNLRRYTANE